MSDTYTTRGGAIKPLPGGSLNTWGTKLNSYNFDLTDKGLYGLQDIAVTTDFALTRTNGDSTSTQINRGIRLTGTPAAAFTVTYLSYEHVLLVRNDTNQSATVKISAGTGVTLLAGQTAFLGYNAGLGDVTNVTPSVIAGALQVAGRISGVTAASAGTDAVNLTQMSAAIALATTSTSPGTFRITSVDTTAKFADTALTVTGALTKTITNVGANEGLEFGLSAASTTQAGSMSANQVKALDAISGKRLTDVSSGTTVATAFNRYRFTAAATITLPTFAANEFIIVEYGATAPALQTVGRNSQTIDGSSTDDTSQRYGDIILYFCNSAGVVVTKHIALLPS